MKLSCPRSFAYLSFVALLLLGTAGICQAKSKVTLLATIDNQPAFRPALWKVFDINDRTRTVALETLPRYSGTVQLPAGKYLATLEFNKIIKETTFRVEPEQDMLVQLPMD